MMTPQHIEHVKAIGRSQLAIDAACIEIRERLTALGMERIDVEAVEDSIRAGWYAAGDRIEAFFEGRKRRTRKAA
ncbi:MAG: hypothetical protein AB1744_02930 [Candidatus Zixiibacteriota bacterium]